MKVKPSRDATTNATTTEPRAPPSTSHRCSTARRRSGGYRSARRSNQASKASATRRTGPAVRRASSASCSASGSCQTLESIGSSVNETKSETPTAKATVTPNWKKILPIIPPMNATGMKTAITASVVAKTASPISSVPSLDAT